MGTWHKHHEDSSVVWDSRDQRALQNAHRMTVPWTALRREWKGVGAALAGSGG